MKYSAPKRLAVIRKQAASCRACPLWRNATQTVFGEGPANAAVMFVGEQPGDKEDIAGHPFIGPAGKLLDHALDEAEIERKKTYITNAVKHFKFIRRGKIRMSRKPNASEIKACRPWYERERDAIRPALIVALGAVAAYSVFGKATPIQKNRGKVFELEGGWKAFVTVHPAALLRAKDEDRKREYARFLGDLRKIAKFIRAQKAA